MKTFYSLQGIEIVNLVKQGSIAVIPTDTIYGISCTVFNKEAVEEIYRIKQRDFDKPFIILCASIEDLYLLDIQLSTHDRNFLNKHWPNPLSAVLPCKSPKFEYLHRGTNSLAIRIPDDKLLCEFIAKTGPIVSTSCNISGNDPVNDIAEAKQILRNQVYFYIDMGLLEGQSSTLIKLDNGIYTILREGAYKIN